MGDLVEGIGDEVLLFGAFLAFAACFVLFANFWRQRENREGQGQSTNPSSQRIHQNDDSSASTQPTSQAHSTNEGSELRSRPGHSAATQPASGVGSSRDEPKHVETERDQQHEEGDESLITVRLILYGSTTKTVRVSATSTLAEMRREHFRQELSENRPVKFIYRGRVLNDDHSPLQQLDITDGCPVHIHVGRPRESPQQRAENEHQQANEFPDLSHYFVPLFGVILGLVWLGLLSYPHIFTFITKLCLFFLSIGYFLLAYLNSFA